MKARIVVLLAVLAVLSCTGCEGMGRMLKPAPVSTHTVVLLPPAADLQPTLAKPVKPQPLLTEGWVQYTNDLVAWGDACYEQQARTRTWVEQNTPKASGPK